MDGYIQLFSDVEVNEQELSQFATDFLTNAGIVRQNGSLGLAGAELSPLDGRKYNITTGGIAYVENSNYAANGTNPKYWLTRFSGATETLEFDANASGSTRIDLICVKVDTAGTALADGTGIVSLVVVKGTAGAGVPATPDDHLALYQVTIANGATVVEDVNVEDVRDESYLLYVPATGAEIITGTQEYRIITPKGLADADLNSRMQSKVIEATRAGDGASGDVSYTGVGFKPTSIHAIAAVNGTAYVSQGFSASDKTARCFYQANATQMYAGNNLAIYTDQGSFAQSAVVKSYDNDGFTLTWTKVASPPANTITLKFLCIK